MPATPTAWAPPTDGSKPVRQRPAPVYQLPGEPGGGPHWTPTRKAELLRRIRAGEIDFDQACARFDLSAEELETWMRRETVFGAAGLKARLVQELRA